VIPEFEEPDLRAVSRGEWEVKQHYIVRYGIKDGGWKSFIIPMGFRCDGASIRRILWTLVGITPTGLISAGAVAHDWLYRQGGNMPELFKEEKWTRQGADDLLFQLMKRAGMRWWRTYMVYWAVRIGGKGSWQGK